MVITQHQGHRRKSGWHTGYAIIKHKGKYYISQESGTRPATAKEIKQLTGGSYEIDARTKG